MTALDAMRSALEMLDLCNQNGWMLADYEPKMYSAITNLRAAIAEMERGAACSLVEDGS